MFNVVHKTKREGEEEREEKEETFEFLLRHATRLVGRVRGYLLNW